MPGGVEVQSLKKRRQQSKKLKEKVNNMVTGGQNFLKAKLSVDLSNNRESYDTMGLNTDPNNSGSTSFN